MKKGVFCGAQGARIGKGVFIDSLDVCDFDLINIGDGVAINEGASISGHYFKDGQLCFGEVPPSPSPCPPLVQPAPGAEISLPACEQSRA